MNFPPPSANPHSTKTGHHENSRKRVEDEEEECEELKA